MKHTLFLIAALLTMISCGGGQKKPVVQELKIDVPKPPAMITDPREALSYMGLHYWDNMNFADTAYIAKPVTEQAFVDYLAIVLSLPPADGAKHISMMMDKAKADVDVYNYFAERSEFYLYDPNSPYRNEELYIAVLENIVSWDALDGIHKLRPQSQLEMALKNRVGHKATDISVRLSTGRTVRLYDIKADYTLLYFINPDCNACAQATDELSRSEIVRQLLDSGELRILTVYPDEDLAAWNKHLGDFPGDWMNAYDEEQKIRDGKIYDLRAIPTMYLLDKNKFVLLKDIPSGAMVHNYFYQTLYK